MPKYLPIYLFKFIVTPSIDKFQDIESTAVTDKVERGSLRTVEVKPLGLHLHNLALAKRKLRNVLGYRKQVTV